MRHVEAEQGIGEIDGLMEIDEVVFVGPRAIKGPPAAPTTLLTPAAEPLVVEPRSELVLDRLLHKKLPALELEWMPGEWLDLRSLGSTPLVLYCQPGIGEGASMAAWRIEHDASASAGCDARLSLGDDAAERDAFAERALDLASMNHRVVGVSSQSAARQLGLATQEALPYVMLSDARLELVEEMGLPTFEMDGMCLYERITLIVRDLRVEKVFYPIADPAAHAAEVVEWLQRGDVDGI